MKFNNKKENKNHKSLLVELEKASQGGYWMSSVEELEKIFCNNDFDIAVIRLARSYLNC